MMEPMELRIIGERRQGKTRALIDLAITNAERMDAHVLLVLRPNQLDDAGATPGNLMLLGTTGLNRQPAEIIRGRSFGAVFVDDASMLLDEEFRVAIGLSLRDDPCLLVMTTEGWF